MIWFSAAAAVLCGAPLSSMASSTSTNEPTAARRGASWLHRAHATNAAEQLAIGRKKESEGRLWRAGRYYLDLVYVWPDSAEAPVAQLAYAQVLEQRGKQADAFEEYQYLIDHYPNQYNHAEVLGRQYAIATNRNEQALYEQVVDNARHGVHAPECQFRLAKLYEDDEDYAMASTEYQLLQTQYPTSPFAAEAAFRDAYCLYQTFIEETPRDESSGLEARNALARFLVQYPDDRNREKAREYLRKVLNKMAAMTYEQARFYDYRIHPRRARAALIVYRDYVRRFPGADQVEAAKIRISELEQELKSDAKSAPQL
jgi:outer membrane protein assembly factor BamD (BamD/ComL family)